MTFVASNVSGRGLSEIFASHNPAIDTIYLLAQMRWYAAASFQPSSCRIGRGRRNRLHSAEAWAVASREPIKVLVVPTGNNVHMKDRASGMNPANPSAELLSMSANCGT